MNYSYPIMETFYSIQGEGFYQGHAAYFVRIAGCDVGCVWCDVKESWDAGKHEIQTVENILNEIKKTNTEIVIVTGGEPLMYDCKPLTDALKKENYKTHIETSAAYPLTGNWDWICISPKKFKVPIEENLIKANELKVVVFNKSDLDWAKKYAEKTNANCELFLQPEWSKEKEMLPIITEFIQQNPRWKLSLQIHKYMGVR